MKKIERSYFVNEELIMNAADISVERKIHIIRPNFPHAALNVMCLRIWRGSKGAGPYMHTMHFFFALGLFIAPLMTKPFLSNKTDAAGETNATEVESSGNFTLEQAEGQESSIGLVYPIIGFMTVVISLGSLYFGIREIFEQRDLKRRR
jgi:fucose permease